MSISCVLPCAFWAQQKVGSATLDWRWSMTHLAPFARSCPMKGWNGNAEATWASSTGRSWQVVPLSLLHFSKVESLWTLPPHFQILLTLLKLAVPCSGSQLSWHWSDSLKKAAFFWGQTCESTVLKVEHCQFERQSGSCHFIHQQRWLL